MEERLIVLRHMRLPNGILSRLVARIGSEGELHLDGHDLDVPEAFSGDGEYEYFKTIAPEHLPALRELLGENPLEDLLAQLARDWCQGESLELERRLRESDIPVGVYVA